MLVNSYNVRSCSIYFMGQNRLLCSTGGPRVRGSLVLLGGGGGDKTFGFCIMSGVQDCSLSLGFTALCLSILLILVEFWELFDFVQFCLRFVWLLLAIYLLWSFCLALKPLQFLPRLWCSVCDEDRWVEPKVWGYIYKNVEYVSLTIYRPGR